jgi:hypothetical protein
MPLKRGPQGDLQVLGPPPGVHDDREALHLLDLRLRECGFPKAQIDWRFLPDRRFRGDLVWPLERIILERDGGTWIRGRHVTAAGFERDCWKGLLAQAAGWCVLRVTPGMLEDQWDDVVKCLRAAFALRNAGTHARA